MSGNTTYVECKISKSKRCKVRLYYGVDSRTEIDDRCCNPCADLLIERSNNRREWDYYHPGEVMPRSEKLK